jgi:hypothetical protein
LFSGGYTIIGCPIVTEKHRDRPTRSAIHRSIRGIPDKEKYRNVILMSECTIKKVLQEAGITDIITRPPVFAIAIKAMVSPWVVGTNCTENRIRIRGCQMGCFP